VALGESEREGEEEKRRVLFYRQFQAVTSESCSLPSLLASLNASSDAPLQLVLHKHGAKCSTTGQRN